MKQRHARFARAALTAAVVLAAVARAAPQAAPPGWRATQLVGMSVESVTGEPLAQVRDIILDRKGVATHLVLAYGGTLGVGATLLAVPWSAATAVTDGKRLVLSRVRLLAAPTFEGGKWPDQTNPAWSAAVDRYWQGHDAARPTGAPDAQIDTHRSRERPERD